MSTDFDSDPELRQLREEFIDSLSDRRVRLSELYEARDRGELRRLVHSLAGVAESYGFGKLGELAGEFDDWLESAKNADFSAVEFSSRVSNLQQALEKVITRRAE